MNSRAKMAALVVALLLALAVANWGCSPKSHYDIPEQDLTPFQRLVHAWTEEYYFRRTVGGDDLVSEKSAIIQRPSHEQRLLIEATLYADTLVEAEIRKLWERDTINVSLDSVRTLYMQTHNWPEYFRIDIRASANLAQPFRLEPLTIFVTDENGIDYEPEKRLFEPPQLAERTYLDREVKRYDPYSTSEYQVYGYRQGTEYHSRARGTLYFERTNVMGRDILSGDEADLTLTLRGTHMEVGRLSWDVSRIQERLRGNGRSQEEQEPEPVDSESRAVF